MNVQLDFITIDRKCDGPKMTPSKLNSTLEKSVRPAIISRAEKCRGFKFNFRTETTSNIPSGSKFETSWRETLKKKNKIHEIGTQRLQL